MTDRDTRERPYGPKPGETPESYGKRIRQDDLDYINEHWEIYNDTGTISQPTWVLEVWCPDCSFQDGQGCFDGGSERELFATKQEAESAGQKATDRTIWKYRVYEQETK